MKKEVVLGEVRKDKKLKEKVFTKKKKKDIIKKDCNPFEVNNKIYKRRDGLCNMEDVVLKETIFIKEESYQQIKEKMCKKDDYFTEKQLKEISVILA